jgi:hypothetical protein
MGWIRDSFAGRMSTVDRELSEGDVFAGHRITAVAGRGGMGVVYRAVQLDLDRPVALKLSAEPLARDADFRERFVRESRATAAIDHPNVIPVYAAGEVDGRLYLAMRFVEGDDLRTLVHATGPLPPAGAATIIAQVGNALDAAHARGLIHRDIKPANVLLDGDHAYLTDFGLTKRLSGEQTVTGAGRWVGTVGYISPEQIRGKPVDARSDVYALGCLLFYLLTGAAPYRRDSDEATLYAHMHEPPADPRALVPGVPAGLAAVTARALAKDPADRFPSAGDLGRAALAAVGRGPAPGPERIVARGDAAPPAAPGDETAVSPATAPTAHAAPRKPAGRTRPWLLPGLALVAVAAIAVAVVALLAAGGSGDGGRGGGGAGATTTAPARPQQDPTTTVVRVGPKPNNVTYVDGRVWVTLQQSNRLIGLAADGSDTAPVRVTLPWAGGAVGVAASRGFLWVLSASTYQLAKIAPDSGRVVKVVGLRRGVMVAIAAGMDRIWVGRRGDVTHDSVLEVDPATGTVSEQPLAEEGIDSLATGGGRLWITNRHHDKVTRLDPAHPDRKMSVPVGPRPRGLAFGHRAIWVADYGDDTLARVTARAMDFSSSPTGGNGPLRVAVSGAGVWVVNGSDNTVSLASATSGDLIEGPIRVGHNPFAITAHGRSAWVADRGDGTVTRLDLPAARP